MNIEVLKRVLGNEALCLLGHHNFVDELCGIDALVGGAAIAPWGAMEIAAASARKAASAGTGT